MTPVYKNYPERSASPQPTLRQLFFLMVAAMAWLTSGCSDSADVELGPKPISPLFNSYVALGNSITAGFQSSGINDSTQRESYARLLANQLNTRYAYASLAGTGCPAPTTVLGAPANTDCSYRDPASATARLNNVAVPGAKLEDLLYASSSQANPLSFFILGGKSQLERARDANPTFISIWIGNNDVLQAAAGGLPSGATPLDVFERQYDSVAQALNIFPALAGGVLIGVVNVMNAPILFPASALGNAQFKAQFDFAAGQSTTLDPACNTNGALLSFAIIAAIRNGSHPPTVSCTMPATPGGVGDIFVLNASEQAQITSIVDGYNNHIRSIADDKSWAYWDPNPLLVSLRTSGCISTVPDVTSPTPFGACVSLDGVHPTGLAHIEIANSLIQAINAKYSAP